MGKKSPSSPVMSADFLVNYLSFGPMRGKVAGGASSTLPVALDPSLVEYLSPDLLAVASAARANAKGVPEHVIRRKVRDALDEARRRIGPVTQEGMRAVSEAVSVEVV